jgi:hypothetical protein
MHVQSIIAITTTLLLGISLALPLQPNGLLPALEARETTQEHPHGYLSPSSSVYERQSDRPFSPNGRRQSDRPFSTNRRRQSDRPFSTNGRRQSDRPFSTNGRRQSDRPFSTNGRWQSDRPFSTNGKRQEWFPKHSYDVRQAKPEKSRDNLIENQEIPQWHVYNGQDEQTIPQELNHPLRSLVDAI